MILREPFIYQKLQDNETPYWELYTVQGYLRSNSPIDIYNPPEGVPDSEQIRLSVEKLQATLNLYRDHMLPGEKTTFAIIMKKNPRSHSTGRFEYQFYLDNMNNEGLGDMPQPHTAQPTSLEGFIPRSVADSERELLKKEILLASKEERLKAWEDRLREKEKEIEKNAQPYIKGAEKAMLSLIEWYTGDNLTSTTQSGLSGVPPEKQTDYQKVEQIASYIYDHFSGDQLNIIEKFLQNFYIKLQNSVNNGISRQENTNSQHTSDTTAETTDNRADSQPTD